MNVTLAAALIGISVLSVLAGIFAALILLFVAPNNILFQAIESIREVFNDGQTQTTTFSPQAQQQILSAASAVKPSSIPEPANTDAPTKTDAKPVDGRSEPPNFGHLFDANKQVEVDDSSAKRERQKTELLADSIRSQPSEHKLDQPERAEAEEVLEAGPPSDAEELMNSGFAADLPDNFKVDGTGSADLINDGTNQADEVLSNEVAGGSSTDEELENQPRDTITVDNEKWQDNSSEEEVLESGANADEDEFVNDSDSMIESQDVLSASSFDDSFDEYQGGSGTDSIDELPVKPPIDPSDTWAKNLSPEISDEEVLVSERSTVAVGQWTAESPAEDIIDDQNVVRGSGEETIDDRQIIEGQGHESFEDMVTKENGREVIDKPKSWEIDGEPKKRKSERSFEIRTQYNRTDRQRDMVLADLPKNPSETIRPEVIRPKDVVIEKDEEVSTEQLRLEALKNSELREILLYLKGPDGGEGEFEIEDLTEEIGAGHERHVSRYPDGTKKLERSTYDGIAHGSFTAWYANGVPMVQGQYERGRATGFWTMWDDEETQLIHAEIGKVLQNWDYKAKVRFVQTSAPKGSR